MTWARPGNQPLRAGGLAAGQSDPGVRDASAGPLLASGSTAEVYEQPNDTVLKLYRPHISRLTIDTEKAALTRAAAAGLPVPTLYDVVNRDGRVGLLLARRHEPTVLRTLVRKPVSWRRSMCAMACVHRQIHALEGGDLPDQKAALRPHLERARIGADLRAALDARLDTLPSGSALCHGDIHFGNLLLSAQGRPCVLDWDKACRGAPAADLARTLVNIRHGRFCGPVPDTLLKIARGYLARSYLSAYQDAGPRLGRWEIDSWLAIMTVAKMPFVRSSERHRMAMEARRVLGT